MTLYPITNGQVVSSNQNRNWERLFQSQGYNTIRQLIDRSISFGTAGTDCFAEAYTSSGGRMNHVVATTRDANTGQPTGTCTSATFDTNKYVAVSQAFTDIVSSGTTHDPNSVTNPSNFFDSNATTYAEKSYGASSPNTSSLGKTFSSTYVAWVYIDVRFSTTGTGTRNVALETYNGTVWSTVVASLATSDYTGAYFLNATVQGIRITMTTTGYDSGGENSAHRYHELHYGTNVGSDCIVYHNIPNGRCTANISTAMLVPYLEDWEAGANIQYKITNSTSDSGWLNCGTFPAMQSFSTFTAQPTALQVKLIPKTSGATGSYPSIRGVTLYTE